MAALALTNDQAETPCDQFLWIMNLGFISQTMRLASLDNLITQEQADDLQTVSRKGRSLNKVGKKRENKTKK
jgi:hypothetical protein